MKLSFIKASALALAAIVSSQPADAITEKARATARISVENLGNMEVQYNRSYGGVWLQMDETVSLPSDSIAVISMPTDSIERVIIKLNDPCANRYPAFLSLYLLPGTTDIKIDPTADDIISVSPSSGNPLDVKAADATRELYAMWFALVTRSHDSRGVWNDTIASSVSGRIMGCVDSICAAYSDASPVVAAALRQDAMTEAISVYCARYLQVDPDRNDPEWKAGLDNMSSAADTSNPLTALSPYLPDAVRYLCYLDRPAGSLSPDSALQHQAKYMIETFNGKTAEAVLGALLHSDGARSEFNPSAIALTERFKEMFPESQLIPLLDSQAEANIAFNNPESSSDIVFVDNSSISSVADLLELYRGTPVLIDIWATWCGPCRKSFKYVGPRQQYAADNGIKLLYLSVDTEDEDKWRKMAQYYGLKGDHVITSPAFHQDIFDTFGNNNGNMGIPLLIFVDQEGRMTKLGNALAENEDFTPLRTRLDSLLNPTE